MSRSLLPFRGRASADGFLFDPSVIGVPEVRRRVSAHWQNGARLLETGDALLLLLPQPVSVRAELAPGLPVRRVSGGVQIVRGGAAVDLDPDRLPRADLGDWLATSELVVARLDPVPSRAEVAAVVVDPPAAKSPDVRRLAGIGPADRRIERERERIGRAGHRKGIGGVGRGGTGRRRDSILAKLALRSPVGAVLGRRHTKYVERLTKQFDSKNWDMALRAAIGLGAGGVALGLRLPKPRDWVRGPSQTRVVAGRSVPYGPTMQQHLAEVYRTAAHQLEREGRILQAAFVLADLLNNPNGAVELLERNGEARTAAELAEGWKLAPDLVVRLWWRSGNRQRAITVARTRGAFATAVDRLQRDDADLARELRRAWFLDCRAAGDHLAAVEAAWPDPALRGEVDEDVAAGMARGGTTAGTLLAHLLNHEPTPQGLDLARSLFGSDPELRASRRGFVHRFARLAAADQAHDRELAGRALLATLVEDPATSQRDASDLRRALRHRCDPVLAADLPPPLAHPAPGPRTTLSLDVTAGGQLSVYDAVAVGADTILLALGDNGTRLVNHRGAVRARWDVPAHRIVLADHGGRALLLADRDGTSVLHELDLPMGRPRALPALRDTFVLDSFDGSQIVAVSPDRIRWMQPDGSRWRVAWEELGNEKARIRHVTRSSGTLAAAFADARSAYIWQWELPSKTLRQRGQPVDDIGVALLADGTAGRWIDGELIWSTPYGNETGRTQVEGEVIAITPVGPGYALVLALADDAGTLLRYFDEPGGPCAVECVVAEGDGFGVRFGVRRHRDLLTVHHPGGRVVVVDLVTRGLVADVRTAV